MKAEPTQIDQAALVEFLDVIIKNLRTDKTDAQRTENWHRTADYSAALSKVAYILDTVKSGELTRPRIEQQKRLQKLRKIAAEPGKNLAAIFQNDFYDLGFFSTLKNIVKYPRNCKNHAKAILLAMAVHEHVSDVGEYSNARFVLSFDFANNKITFVRYASGQMPIATPKYLYYNCRQEVDQAADLLQDIAAALFMPDIVAFEMAEVNEICGVENETA